MPKLISNLANEALWDSDGLIGYTSGHSSTRLLSITGNTSVATQDEGDESPKREDMTASANQNTARKFSIFGRKQESDTNDNDQLVSPTPNVYRNAKAALSTIDNRNQLDGAPLLIRQQAVVFNRPSSSQGISDIQSLDNDDESETTPHHVRHISPGNIVRLLSALTIDSGINIGVPEYQGGLIAPLFTEVEEGSDEINLSESFFVAKEPSGMHDPPLSDIAFRPPASNSKLPPMSVMHVMAGMIVQPQFRRYQKSPSLSTPLSSPEASLQQQHKSQSARTVQSTPQNSSSCKRESVPQSPDVALKKSNVTFPKINKYNKFGADSPRRRPPSNRPGQEEKVMIPSIQSLTPPKRNATTTSFHCKLEHNTCSIPDI